MIIWYCLLFFGCSLHIQAQDSVNLSSFSMRGFIKNLQMISFYDDMNQSISSNMVHNRVSATYGYNKGLSFRADIRNRLFWGDQEYLPTIKQTLQSKPGAMGMSEILIDGSGILLHSIIDRLSISYGTNHWKITAGRQRINWGINNVWNPNDIFNTFNILDFDYEERPGCDAIRIQHLKDDYAVELAIKPDSILNQSIGALLVKTNYSGYDVQCLIGLYMEDFIIGGGWSGNIGDAGFKGECTYFHPMSDNSSSSETITTSLQLDKTFSNELYCSIGALYNGNTKQQSLMSLSNSNLSPKHLFPTEISFFIGIQKQLNPIQTVGGTILYSPFNNALILVPNFSYNIADNIDIDFIGQIYFVKNQTHQYSNIATSLFFRSRWSF